jgi:hypothetical protein
MILKRRNFIQVVSLGLATVASGFKVALPEKPTPPDTKTLDIVMPSRDGKYVFYIDGQKQLLQINSEKGILRIPTHSCIIKYLAADGVTKLSVYIDQDTAKSHLLPGLPLTEVENDSEWNAVILGNPIREGKLSTQISGPINTSAVIEVLDIQGRSLLKEKVNKTKSVETFTLDVQSFAKGMLLVKVSSDDFTRTMKVLHVN